MRLTDHDQPLFPALFVRSGRHLFSIRWLLRLIIIIAVVGAAAPAKAATITVTTTADDNTVNGNCTLREAVQAANSNAAVDACAAGSGADTLVFAPALAGQTISLAISGDNTYGPSALAITSPVTVDGAAAAGLVVARYAGAGRLRLFYVAAAGNLTVKDLTLQGGLAQGGNGGGAYNGGGGGAGLGGAILNAGTLSATRVKFLGNQAIGGNGGSCTTTSASSSGGGGGGGLAGDGGGNGGTNQAGGGGGGPNGGSAGGQNVAGGPGGFGGGGGGGGGQCCPGGAGGTGGFGGGGGAGGYANPGGAGGLFGGGAGGGTGGAGGLLAGAGGRGDGGGSGAGGGGAGIGGAIFNHGGSVTLSQCTLDGNLARGGSGGNSASSSGDGGEGGRGGGGAGTLFNYNGTLSIDRTTFSNNQVQGGSGGDTSQGAYNGPDAGPALGGGVYTTGGTVTVTNSTFSAQALTGGTGGRSFCCGGTTTGNGGDAKGGAIYALDSTVNVRLSTLLNATLAGGPYGGMQSSGSANGVNGTATGGGIYLKQTTTASLFLSNSVLANNAGGVDGFIESGTVTGDRDLVKTSSGFPGGVITLTGEPLLGPLGNNGGPTFTHKPSTSASPVINAGDCLSGSITVDQRGQGRPQGGCDIGSVEVAAGAGTTIVVNTTADELNNDGDCSLREAVQAANLDQAVDACAAGNLDDVIAFDPALNGQTITLSTVGDSTYGPSALAILSAITIRQAAGRTLTISRDAAVPSLRLFYIPVSGNLTLDNLTVSGGLAKGGNGGAGRSGGGGAAGLGGAIFNAGTLTITGSRLTGNQAVGGNGGSGNDVCCGSNLASGGGGGGLGADGGGGGGNPTGGAGGGPNGGAAGGYQLNGAAGGPGGGGGGAGGTNGSTNNLGGAGGWGAGGGGGSTSGYGALSGAFGGGGGGQSCCGTDNADLFGGSGGYKGTYGYGGGGGAFGGGAAIFNLGGSISLVNSTVSGNASTGGSGGGTVSASGNSGAPGHGGMAGGALFNQGGTVTCTASTFSGNTALGGNGGGAAVSSYNGGNANHARGAALFSNGGTVALTDCTFSGNTATGGTGGGSSGTAGNGGTGQGGAIFTRDTALTMKNDTVAFNGVVAGPKGSGSGGANGGADTGGLYVWQDVGTSTAALSNNLFSNSTAGVEVTVNTATATGSLNLIRSNSGVPAGLISSTADPLLYALSANGGPTQTHAIPSTSPALDAGDCAGGTVSVDQRGVTRPQRGGCDLGAYENAAGEFDAVAITGATWGAANKSYLFTATISPANPATPITYTWSTAGQADQVHVVSSGVDTASFSWPTQGAKTVTVVAVNAYGQKTGGASFTITQPVANPDTASSFVPPADNFETGGFSPSVGWSFSGNQAWTVTTADKHGGSYGARGGPITHSQNTVMQFTKTYPAGTLGFWARVSSEQNYDFLRFYIDGAQQFAISGNGGWNYYSYAIAAGSHTFAWRYDKDGSVSSNSDTGFVDDIAFVPTVPQSLNEDTLFAAAAPGVLANDTHPFGSALTAVVASGTTAKGALYTVNANGSYSYDPRASATLQALKAGQSTTDTFTYTVVDSEGGAASATVTATVDGVNDLPVAAANSYSVAKNNVLTVATAGAGVLGNDSDVDGDPLTAVKDADPAHGALTLNADGTFTYTPTADYVGPDGFTYHANDGTGNSPTVTVSLTVYSLTPGFVADRGANALRVVKNGANLALSWGAGCGTTLTDYAVYAGTLGTPGSHLPVTCTTAGATTQGVTPAAGNAYYLIVPLSASAEGSYGMTSAGTEIPVSAAACKAIQVLPNASCQ